MKRSLKALVATAAFMVCMCATMIVGFAATDLKLDPVSLIAYSQDASASETGVSIPGSELFIGLDTGSYTFADVAASLDDYGLEYQVTDGANGYVYLIGSAIELGPDGAFEDLLSADGTYYYNIIGDGYQPIVVTIATKNAEEVVSVVGDAVGNGLPDEVTDTLDNIYTGITDVAPDILYDIGNEIPGFISGVVGPVTEGYSDVIDEATKALEGTTPEDVQDFVDTTVGDIADAAGDVIDNVADTIGDVDVDALIANLLDLLFQ